MSPSPDGHPQDRELVARFLANPHDAEALNLRLQFVPRFLRIRNAHYGHPFDSHTLDDLASQATLAILRKLSTYRGDGPLEAFCARFCDFELRNMLRAHRRQRQRYAPLDDHGDPAQPIAHETLDETCLNALDRLGGVEAETIRLRVFDELDFEAIARRTGTSAVNVRSRLSRGLARLRQMLGERRGGHEQAS